MDITINPRPLQGSVAAIPSKSQAHRLLICAAFADAPTALTCPQTNEDITATAECLNALGAKITRTDTGYSILPTKDIPRQAVLNCRESGSTLRFLLPIVGALGVDAIFQLSGRLPQRPLSPLWEEMERMGCGLSRPTADTIRCCRQLKPGQYRIDGGVSSQFITGLLYAMALMDGESSLTVTGKTESKPYIEMTRRALAAFGVDTEDYHVTGSRPFHSPGTAHVEGDWSNAAFFLAARALGSELTVTGLDADSPQGDRAVADILEQLSDFRTVSAADIPDLVPVLAIVAGAKRGAVFTDIGRLRLKESDRVASVAAMLQNLGARVETTEDTLTVHPATFRGCTVNASHDHRIAMAAAVAATVARGPVTILGADCVSKSYPGFWEEYRRLGGSYEQHIR